MKTRNLGRDNAQIVTDFRRVLETNIDIFKARRDHVSMLLGSRQNYESGIYRETLLRSFLKEVLPAAVSVDTGFVRLGESGLAGKSLARLRESQHACSQTARPPLLD